ncbi:hypothetical protein MBLNU459_g1160t2 [Dothideomycetes sp. NU459]
MSNVQAADPRRPRTLHISRSFTRLESPKKNPDSPSRSRASTIQTPTIHTVPEARDIRLTLNDGADPRGGDIFERTEDDDEHPVPELAKATEGEAEAPQTFDQLPIEIRSLSERFLKSLGAKVHVTPLTIDTIADLFQDFYVKSESHIETHIATLATRLSREKSATASVSSKSPILSKGGKRGTSTADSGSPADATEQQMLTASEVTERRKARRLLDLKRIALEEAVERGICEKVYDRIYRHRSADDEERDAKLRSKTAALELVGIGLKELHVNIKPSSSDDSDEANNPERKVYELLAPARESLQRMDDEHYPLGKLQRLTEAHKAIVETLSHVFPSSSSADEVLPTLIYTLITSPPDKINVISNLHFVQLFRAHNRVDGEAAYCLVNLEAAISFLETVDLSSLRADEVPEGPGKTSSRPQTPVREDFKHVGKDESAAPGQPSSPRALTPGLTPESAISSDLDPGSAIKPLPSPASLAGIPRPAFGQRRLSSMIQAQAERIEASREELISSADHAFDAINSTLENSFKFLFGRLKEQQDHAVAGQESPLVVPKTLEDARKLVSSPTLDPADDTNSISGRSSINEITASDGTDDPLSESGKAQNNMLTLVAGRLRERSVDSNRSMGSGKRVSFAEKGGQAPDRLVATSAATTAASAADSVGNLMHSLNPLKSFAVPSFGRFGRSASTTTSPAISTPTTEKNKQLDQGSEATKATETNDQDNTAAKVQPEQDLSALEALAQLRKTKPPVRKFMDVKDVKDLRIGEVEDLLKDYRRLAEAIREALSS